MDKEFQLARQLLKLLNSESRWFTLAEIEAELKISDKTVRRIVEEINKELQPSILIKVLRGRGIYLNIKEESQTIDEVVSLLFKKTTFYRLFHLLFVHDGQLSMDEMAEKLFMSTSSLKKLIIELNNKDLKPYYLRITYGALQVKGNEIHIRYFYWKLYTDAYEFSGWPFKPLDYEKINQSIKKVEEQEGIIFFINSKRRLAFLLAIILKRMTKGHFVQLNKESSEWEKRRFYKSVLLIVNGFRTDRLSTWPIHEIQFLQSIMNLSQFSSFETNDVYGKMENIQGEYRASSKFLGLINDYFPNIDKSERFIMEVNEFFYKLLIDNEIPELLPIWKSNLTGYVQKECQPIYEQVEICMHKWNTFFPEVLYTEYHLTRLALLINTHLLYKNKKAFLLIGEEFSIRHYVAKLIKKEIGDELIINTSIMEGLTDEIVQQHAIDFVISNFPIALKSVPVVVISTIPTKRDLENIRKRLVF